MPPPKIAKAGKRNVEQAAEEDGNGEKEKPVRANSKVVKNVTKTEGSESIIKDDAAHMKFEWSFRL